MWGVGGLQFGNVESGPTSAVTLGVAAFICGWAVLSFFSALLLNVVDAAHVCFSLDSNMNTQQNDSTMHCALQKCSLQNVDAERLHHCTLQIVDAVFVCFALDRDMNTCTIVEVHEVVSKLPTVGPVFEQPDGRIAYGNPQRV
eukprot:1159036-Pelagomonas_calceolata.AAC.13